jgi:hypothetical protein
MKDSVIKDYEECFLGVIQDTIGNHLASRRKGKHNLSAIQLIMLSDDEPTSN